jgi:hypothetical protein
MFLGGPLARLISTTSRLVGGEGLSVAADTVALLTLMTGALVFLLSLFSVAIRNVAFGWSQRKRHIVALRPLWLALCAQFPDLALRRPGSALGELMRIRNISYAYRRRIIECRDGLWQASTYIDIAEVIGDSGEVAASIDKQAQMLHLALSRAAGHAPERGEPFVIAAPSATDTLAEDDALIRLARAFRERLEDLGAPSADPSSHHLIATPRS